MIKILWFLVIFAVVVIAHEFGHFLIAKMNGVRVVEFTVGAGPILLKRQGKETLYTWRLLPLGGACIFDQEDGLEEEEKKKKQEQQEQELIPSTERDRSLNGASVWVRIATYAAGPIFNFLLAFLLSLVVVGMSGSDDTKIAGIVEGYPAQEAGLQVGDRIISLNGERVHLYREVSIFSQLNQGGDVKIVYEREGKRYTTTLTPRYDEQAGRYYMGFSGGLFEDCNAIETIKASYYEVRYWIKITYKSLFMLFRGEASVSDLSGPVGMAQVVGEVYEEASEYGFLTLIASMLNFAILLSANLGVVNLLPLPALDGGRLVFAFIEAVRGKPVPRKKEAIVHFIGVILLLALMVFVMFNDIRRLFH